MEDKRDLREKLEALVIFNSPSAVIDGVMEIIQQEIDKAREEGAELALERLAEEAIRQGKDLIDVEFLPKIDLSKLLKEKE